MSKEQNDEKNNINAENDDERTEVSGKVSVIENMRRINRKQRQEELEAEAEREKERAERERRERESYEKRLEHDRIELMKLKQGIISDEDIPCEEKIVKEYTIAERIGNFFYHNKMPLFVGALIVLLAVLFVRDIITNKKPDVEIGRAHV